MVIVIRTVSLLLLQLLLTRVAGVPEAASTAASAGLAAKELCDATKGGTDCPVAATAMIGTEELPGPPPAPATQERDVNTTTVVKRKEIGFVWVIFLLTMFGAVALQIIATIKFAMDGSLPARLALWGLLPEAYAAISVRAVAALLRLKKGETPVIVLRNCVTNEGAVQLAEAMRKYGTNADLQALELPHNPALGEEGLRAIAATALLEGSPLQELDLSYNPQLCDCITPVLRPLLEPKVSKLNTLRLVDCGLTDASLRQFADRIDRTRIRLLDLSWNSLKGAGEVLAALCEAPILEELMLACCDLSTDDVRVLAEQLPFTSIKSIQLGGNKFGNEGLLALAATLPETMVDELGLESCSIETKCLASLGEAWAKRPFSRVKLTGNHISPDEIARFVRTLKSIHA